MYLFKSKTKKKKNQKLPTSLIVKKKIQNILKMLTHRFLYITTMHVVRRVTLLHINDRFSRVLFEWFLK